MGGPGYRQPGRHSPCRRRTERAGGQGRSRRRQAVVPRRGETQVAPPGRAGGRIRNFQGGARERSAAGADPDPQGPRVHCGAGGALPARGGPAGRGPGPGDFHGRPRGAPTRCTRRAQFSPWNTPALRAVPSAAGGPGLAPVRARGDIRAEYRWLAVERTRQPTPRPTQTWVVLARDAQLDQWNEMGNGPCGGSG